MVKKIETLEIALRFSLKKYLQSLTIALGEITIVVKSSDYFSAMQILHDHPDTSFTELIDLCGVDYSTYGNEVWNGQRFAVVLHLLSMCHNWRVRVRVFATNDYLPLLASVINIWPAANWYEREAFDLFGILFDGHDDLRRILTDYGFIGYPFRKDFPVFGYVEMHYDAEQKRVIYQPVTIESRELIPRVIREENYGIK